MLPPQYPSHDFIWKNKTLFKSCDLKSEIRSKNLNIWNQKSRNYCRKFSNWQLKVQLIVNRGNNLTTGNNQLTFLKEIDPICWLREGKKKYLVVNLMIFVIIIRSAFLCDTALIIFCSNNINNLKEKVDWTKRI